MGHTDNFNEKQQEKKKKRKKKSLQVSNHNQVLFFFFSSLNKRGEKLKKIKLWETKSFQNWVFFKIFIFFLNGHQRLKQNSVICDERISHFEWVDFTSKLIPHKKKKKKKNGGRGREIRKPCRSKDETALAPLGICTFMKKRPKIDE